MAGFEITFNDLWKVLIEGDYFGGKSSKINTVKYNDIFLMAIIQIL